MNIFTAFIEIQKALPPLVKDTQGHGYKYPTLNQILDIVLEECHARNIGLSQKAHPVDIGHGVGVETIIFNAEGESLSSGVLAMPLTEDNDGNIINVGNVNKQGKASGQYGAQAYGSALTYARRYSLTAFFGMKAEDDDGSMASRPARRKEPQQDYYPDQDEPVISQMDAAKNELDLAKTMEELAERYQALKMWKWSYKKEWDEVVAYKDKRKEELK